MDRLSLILTTLNRVEVSGAENLSRMLGCIQELEKLREEQAHEADDRQGTDL